MMLFGMGTGFEVPATEWRAAYVQGKYYGELDCSSTAFANCYARTWLSGAAAISGSTNVLMYLLELDLCEGLFREASTSDRTILRVATMLALLESDPRLVLRAMVEDGIVSGGVAFLLHQWVRS